MRSHRRGENVVTITSIQPRSTNSAREMMHSARDLHTRLRIDLAIQVGSALEPVPHAQAQVTPIGVLAQVRVCCDTPQEASVVDALASFGGARGHALDAGQHLARHPGAGLFGGTCSPVFPPEPPGLKSRGAATGRYGPAACAWSLAQVSLRPRVRLKTRPPGVG